MSAQSVWAGLSHSVFLTGIDERERDPGRILVVLVGGFVLGMVAAICGLLLVMVAYAIMSGEGARGLAGLLDAARALGDVKTSSPALAVLRLIATTAVDAVFLVVFVAVAAVMYRQPLKVFITRATHVRWRLLGVAMALSAAAVAPIVVAERLLSPDGPTPPFLSVSPFVVDQVIYCFSALLLIPAAAAEELLFRGWLLRQTGAFVRRPLLLLAVTSLTFSALHFDFNPDAFLTRALMGAGFAYMTLRLGGIEFSAGVHAVNNMMIVLFLQSLNFQQTTGPDLSPFSLVEDIVLIGGYVLITELVARSAALRRLAGVSTADLSPTLSVSAQPLG
jgi:membrane protease YdiL (CAAX protease family)